MQLFSQLLQNKKALVGVAILAHHHPGRALRAVPDRI